MTLSGIKTEARDGLTHWGTPSTGYPWGDPTRIAAPLEWIAFDSEMVGQGRGCSAASCVLDPPLPEDNAAGTSKLVHGVHCHKGTYVIVLWPASGAEDRDGFHPMQAYWSNKAGGRRPKDSEGPGT